MWYRKYFAQVFLLPFQSDPIFGIGNCLDDVIMNRGGKNGWIFGRKTKELNIEYCPFEFYGLQFKYSIFNRKYSI
jgi:hypothetical protein